MIMLICTSCSIAFIDRTPTYAYNYKCLRCNYKDSVLYANTLYYPGDTVVEIPSKNTILITNVRLTKDLRDMERRLNNRKN